MDGAQSSSTADELPSISVVTPSFNQGRFIEQNILSLQAQAYPGLEHIVIDGGSTDDTLRILEKHRRNLTKIVVEKDEGQYYAINKGFGFAAGEIMAWLNSDDVYFPGTLRVVGEIFRTFPQIEWLTTGLPAAIDEHGALIKVTPVYGFTHTGFLRGDNLPGLGWPATCYIQQESTFWRRSLWERAGGNLDTRFSYAGDFDLWARFFEQAQLFSVDVPIGCFRRHGTQKTSVSLGTYIDEAKDIFAWVGGRARTGRLQNLRVWMRQSLPEAILAFACGRGLIDPAPRVTYDWAAQKWVVRQG